MTTVIIIPGGDLDSYYEEIQEYLLAKYHTYPTGVPDLDISESEIYAQGYFSSMASHSAPLPRKKKKRKPIGKLIV